MMKSPGDICQNKSSSVQSVWLMTLFKPLKQSHTSHHNEKMSTEFLTDCHKPGDPVDMTRLFYFHVHVFRKYRDHAVAITRN